MQPLQSSNTLLDWLITRSNPRTLGRYHYNLKTVVAKKTFYGLTRCWMSWQKTQFETLNTTLGWCLLKVYFEARILMALSHSRFWWIKCLKAFGFWPKFCGFPGAIGAFGAEGFDTKLIGLEALSCRRRFCEYSTVWNRSIFIKITQYLFISPRGRIWVASGLKSDRYCKYIPNLFGSTGPAARGRISADSGRKIDITPSSRKSAHLVVSCENSIVLQPSRAMTLTEVKQTVIQFA